MAARDKAILDAALELFAEHGFAAVGVDRIGERAGVPGPAIYRHFSGKAELLATLVDQAMDHLLALTAGSAEDPHEELALLVRGHVRFALSHRLLLAVYAQEARSLPPDDRRRARRRQRAYVERWVDVLGRVHREHSDVELRVAAHGAIGLIQASINWPRALLGAPGLAAAIEAAALRTLGVAHATDAAAR
ncbi:MAG TPA: TetR/AcrR family transcriptional regulator [Solirubrobacteraceae bacterium]|nr:TetR/AcrR family transcriptional regulator [Solirubrobacteraceae bacterium]